MPYVPLREENAVSKKPEENLEESSAWPRLTPRSKCYDFVVVAAELRKGTLSGVFFFAQLLHMSKKNSIFAVAK